MLRSAAYSETAANRANMQEKIFFMMFLILVKHMLVLVFAFKSGAKLLLFFYICKCFGKKNAKKRLFSCIFEKKAVTLHPQTVTSI